MRILLLFFNVIFVLLLNCGDDKTLRTSTKKELLNQDRKITAKVIDSFDYKDYVLSSSGERSVADWEKYQELAIQIGYLKQADLSFFNSESVPLQKFVDAFKTSIPEDLNNNPISSRILVIETTLFRLNMHLTLDNIPVEDQLQSIEEVLVAFSNLNYQINKKLVRDKYEIMESEYSQL